MKRILLTSIIVLLFCSCHKVIYKQYGDWAPVELSQETIHFGPEGGSLTVEALNYSSWCVLYMEDVIAGNGYPAERRTHYPDYVLGDGICAQVDPDRKNALVIAVEPDPEKHVWHIEMTAGDVYRTVEVTQN